jgi:hypothetical protein
MELAAKSGAGDEEPIAAAVPEPHRGCDICQSLKIFHSDIDHDAIAVIARGLPLGMKTLPPNESPHVTWTGQVFGRRDIGKNMIFASLRKQGTELVDPIELLISNRFLEGGAAACRTLRYGLHPGDIVEAHGWLENSDNVIHVGTQRKCLLLVRWLRVVTLWSEMSTLAFQQFAVASDVSDNKAIVDTSIASCDASGDPATTCIPGNVRPKNVVRVERFFHGVPLHLLCKYQLERGACHRVACPLVHDLDPYLHDADHPITRSAIQKEWRLWQIDNRAQGTLVVEGDTFHVEDKVAHRARAHEFVKWLLATVPHDMLAAGVLDVAGGRGDISHLLAMQLGVRSTVVDPRPEKRRKFHLKQYAEHKEVVPPNYAQTYFDDDFVKHEHYSKLFHEAGFVIGFHPDQATEPIVDMALKHKKPFVIVPCCVFSREFPDRRLRNGSEVSSYLDFLQYLQEKDLDAAPGAVSGLQKAWMPYSGANTILYKLSYDTKSA